MKCSQDTGYQSVKDSDPREETNEMNPAIVDPAIPLESVSGLWHRGWGVQGGGVGEAQVGPSVHPHSGARAETSGRSRQLESGRERALQKPQRSVEIKHVRKREASE